MQSENQINHQNSWPLVSIGLPVYNGEKYIREAIESALSQDYPNLEIIISDNASYDETENICRDYVKRDKRIRYFRNSNNLGVVRNFLQTLEYASGEYFTWLAHDDLLSSKQYVSTVVSFMVTHPDVVCCGCSIDSFYDENPQARTKYSFEWMFAEKDWRQVRQEFFRYPTQVDLMAYAMYKTDVLIKNEFMYYKIDKYIDSHILVLASLCKDGRIVALPETLRSYRCHLDSLSYNVVPSYFVRLFRHSIRKMTLFKIALKFPLPWKEKIKLMRVVSSNFLSFRLVTIKNELKMLRKEAAMLNNACKERLELIQVLNAENKNKTQIINALRLEIDQNNKNQIVS